MYVVVCCMCCLFCACCVECVGYVMCVLSIEYCVLVLCSVFVLLWYISYVYVCTDCSLLCVPVLCHVVHCMLCCVQYYVA